MSRFILGMIGICLVGFMFLANEPVPASSRISQVDPYGALPSEAKMKNSAE